MGQERKCTKCGGTRENRRSLVCPDNEYGVPGCGEVYVMTYGKPERVSFMEGTRPVTDERPRPCMFCNGVGGFRFVDEVTDTVDDTCRICGECRKPYMVPRQCYGFMPFYNPDGTLTRTNTL